MNRNVIGVAGNAGVGKDTLADIIVRKMSQRDYDIVKVPYAYPLKRQLHLLFALHCERLYGSDKAKTISVTLDERVLKVLLRSEYRWLWQSLSDDGFEDVLDELVEECLQVFRSYFRIKNYKGSPVHNFEASTRQLMQVFGTDFARECIQDDIWLMFNDRYREQRNADYYVISDVRFANEAEDVLHQGTLVFVERPGHARIEHSNHGSETEVFRVKEMRDYIVINDTYKGNLYENAEGIICDILQDAWES